MKALTKNMKKHNGYRKYYTLGNAGPQVFILKKILSKFNEKQIDSLAENVYNQGVNAYKEVMRTNILQ